MLELLTTFAQIMFASGIHFLLFFSYGLEKHFREDLYEDFEQLTFEFYEKGNIYGLEKYW